MGEARAFVVEELKEAAGQVSGGTLQPYKTDNVTLALNVFNYIFQTNPRFL